MRFNNNGKRYFRKTQSTMFFLEKKVVSVQQYRQLVAACVLKRIDRFCNDTQ